MVLGHCLGSGWGVWGWFGVSFRMSDFSTAWCFSWLVASTNTDVLRHVWIIEWMSWKQDSLSWGGNTGIAALKWGPCHEGEGRARARWSRESRCLGTSPLLVRCRENRCFQQPFQWEQTQKKVVVTPQCLIAMETWVISKATSKASLPVALLDVLTEVCKP